MRAVCATVALALLLATPAAGAQTRVFIASDSTAQDYAPEHYPQEGWGMARFSIETSGPKAQRALVHQ